MPATEPGVLALSGPVTFDHTASLAARLRGQAGQAQALDWSGVTQVDSSAVALMLELARAAGHRHQQRQLPASLLSLIALYGVNDLVCAP
mgnify:FL=1